MQLSDLTPFKRGFIFDAQLESCSFSQLYIYLIYKIDTENLVDSSLIDSMNQKQPFSFVCQCHTWLHIMLSGPSSAKSTISMSPVPRTTTACFQRAHLDSYLNPHNWSPLNIKIGASIRANTVLLQDKLSVMQLRSQA